MPELYPYQKQALESTEKMWAEGNTKTLLCLEPRMGKTPIACVAASKWSGRTLIVCPAKLTGTWIREMSIWGPKVDFQVLSYDSLNKLTKYPDNIILDESHRIKNPEAKRSKRVDVLARRAKYAMALSGTPIPNKPIEIWQLLNTFGVYRQSYHAFGMQYCAGWKTPWKTWDFSGSSNEDELRQLVSSRAVIMSRDQVGDFREKQFRVVPLNLRVNKAEKNYSLDDLEGAMSPSSFVGLSELMREQGEAKIKDSIEYIKEYLEEGESIIVFAHHKVVVEGLMEGLAEYNPVKIVGGTSQKKVLEAVDKFQSEESKVLVGNIISASEGFTLPRADRIVMAEASWVPSVIAQASDRATYRGGGSIPVDILTVDKSIDEYMLYRTLEKVSVINKIIVNNHQVKKEKMMANEKSAVETAMDVLVNLIAEAVVEKLAERGMTSQQVKTVQQVEMNFETKVEENKAEETKPEEVVAEEKKPTKRATKKTAPKVEEPLVEEPVVEEPVVEDVVEIDINMIRAEFVAAFKDPSRGKEFCMKLLNEDFKVPGITSLTEDQYAPFMKALKGE